MNWNERNIKKYDGQKWKSKKTETKLKNLKSQMDY